MSALTWGALGAKKYENGVEQVALYLFNKSTKKYDTGFAWNGVEKISESPEGADASDFYADNVKYATLRAAETFGCTIEAYTSPKEFDACDGQASLATGIRIGQQERATFGLSYITNKGDDANGQNGAYRIHLVYGATASPSSKDYSSVNDSPDLASFSWEVKTTPVAVTNHKPTATLTIDSDEVDADKLTAFLAILHGTTDVEPKLPTPDEVLAHFSAA